MPIVNENDTVSPTEGRFGDNDTLSAITAGLVSADYLFLCTDVDGLYTANPRENPDARRLGVVRSVADARQAASVASAGSTLGTGGMQTKLVAAELATAAGVATVILGSDTPQHIAAVVAQGAPATDDVPLDPPHTFFVPQSTRVPDHKWTILHALQPAGALIIDRGAYERLQKKESGGRLLPAGVAGVQGVFERLQAVRLLVDTDGGLVEVGRALANYTSIECERIRGMQSSQIRQVLGYADTIYITDQVALAPAP